MFFGLACISISRLVLHDWRSPAMIYSLIWVSSCILPPCLLWRDMSWDYDGLFWIIASCFVTTAGEVIGKNAAGRKKHNPVIQRKFYLNVKKAKTILLFMTSMNTLYVLSGIFRQGFSLSVFYNMASLLSINSASAYNRYHGGGTPSIVNQLFLVSQYSAPLFGGFSMPYFTSNRDKRIAAASLLPVLLGVVISNAKAGFIASVMGFCVTYMTGCYVCTGRRARISRRFIINTVICLCAFLGILFISFCLRIGDFSASTLNIVRYKFMIYTFGNVKAFDEWLTYDAAGSPDKLMLGIMTYNWFFNLTKIAVRRQGVYGLARSIRSNVFSAFRGIIMDFGIYGGLIYCLLHAFAGGYIYSRLHEENRAYVLGITLLCANYFFILYSFIISTWTYTTFFASYVLFFIIMTKCRDQEAVNFA